MYMQIGLGNKFHIISDIFFFFLQINKVSVYRCIYLYQQETASITSYLLWGLFSKRLTDIKVLVQISQITCLLSKTCVLYFFLSVLFMYFPLIYARNSRELHVEQQINWVKNVDMKCGDQN